MNISAAELRFVLLSGHYRKDFYPVFEALLNDLNTPQAIEHWAMARYEAKKLQQSVSHCPAEIR